MIMMVSISVIILYAALDRISVVHTILGMEHGAVM